MPFQDCGSTAFKMPFQDCGSTAFNSEKQLHFFPAPKIQKHDRVQKTSFSSIYAACISGKMIIYFIRI